MESCVFCKIVKGETPTKFEKETQNMVVFKDIQPQAPLHLLIVPRLHIKDATEVTDEIWTEIKDVVLAIARQRSLSGFRIVHNSGDAAAVPHMHVHLLGEVAAERSV